MMQLIEKIDDLIKQATTERSHYYVASILKECKAALSDAEAVERENAELRLYKNATINQESAREKRIKELEAQLDAWQTVFGTSQLTHAQSRLEQAENAQAALATANQERDALREDKNRIEKVMQLGCQDSESVCPYWQTVKDWEKECESLELKITNLQAALSAAQGEVEILRGEVRVKCKDCNRLDAFDENVRLREALGEIHHEITWAIQTEIGRQHGCNVSVMDNLHDILKKIQEAIGGKP